MSAGSSTSTLAAIGLQLAGDLGHPFRRQVVRRAVRQVAAEGHPLANRQALVQRILVGAENLDLLDRSAHRIGIAHATVDRGRPVCAGHGARRGRAPLLAALAVTKPQPEGLRVATVQPTRRDGRQPACPPRASAPRSGIEEEQAPGGEGARIDKGGGMLDGVELAPVDGRADRAAGCPVEIAEVAVEVALVAVDRDREDVDVGRGGGRGNGAHTHAQRAPSAGRQTGGEYTGHWQSANRAEYRLNVLPGATGVPAGGSWSMMPARLRPVLVAVQRPVEARRAGRLQRIAGRFADEGRDEDRVRAGVRARRRRWRGPGSPTLPTEIEKGQDPEHDDQRGSAEHDERSDQPPRGAPTTWRWRPSATGAGHHGRAVAAGGGGT